MTIGRRQAKFVLLFEMNPEFEFSARGQKFD